MVFCVEAESDRVAAQRFADGASDGWSGNAALEKLRIFLCGGDLRRENLPPLRGLNFYCGEAPALTGWANLCRPFGAYVWRKFCPAVRPAKSNLFASRISGTRRGRNPRRRDRPRADRSGWWRKYLRRLRRGIRRSAWHPKVRNQHHCTEKGAGRLHCLE